MANEATRGTSGPELAGIEILLFAAAGAATGFQLIRGFDSLSAVDWLLIAAAAVLAFLGIVSTFVRTRAELIRTAARFQDVAAEAIASVERTLPPHAPSLEDEIAEVSDTLTKTVARLREISAKAQAFEGEVRELVERAEAAQAVAELNEDQASKISLLLSERTEQSLKAEIEKLKAAHAEQAEQQRRSGTRVALATFAGGVILGVIGNVVTNLVML